MTATPEHGHSVEPRTTPCTRHRRRAGGRPMQPGTFSRGREPHVLPSLHRQAGAGGPREAPASNLLMGGSSLFLGLATTDKRGPVAHGEPPRFPFHSGLSSNRRPEGSGPDPASMRGERWRPFLRVYWNRQSRSAPHSNLIPWRPGNVACFLPRLAGCRRTWRHPVFWG